MKVARGGILFARWKSCLQMAFALQKQEITLERVGERQKQAQVRGGGGRKARDSAGTGAGLDVGWPDAEQLSSAWGGLVAASAARFF